MLKKLFLLITCYLFLFIFNGYAIEDISLKKLQWVVLMVLLSQPNEEVAFTQMENIVYEDNSPFLH